MITYIKRLILNLINNRRLQLLFGGITFPIWIIPYGVGYFIYLIFKTLKTNLCGMI